MLNTPHAPASVGLATRRRYAVARLAATATALLLTSTNAALQTPEPPETVGQTTRVTPAEAARTASEARAAMPARLADDLTLTVWATGGVAPASLVAVDVAPDGAAYITVARRSGGPLDTRQHPDWVPEVLSLRTTEDLRQFFHPRLLRLQRGHGR